MKENSLFGYLKTAFILLCICALSAALLGAINSITSPIIEAANIERTEEMIKTIFPEYSSYQELEYKENGISSVKSIENSKGEIVGYIVEATISGFKDAINIMVGLEKNATVKSVKIISHSETPGLGSKITGEDYLQKYVGKSGVITFESGIDSLSGATLSSSSVLEGVNLAIKTCEQIAKEDSDER